MISIRTPKHLMNRTLEVYARSTAVASDGTPNVSWASASTACVLRCFVRPSQGGEGFQFGTDNTTERLSVIADPEPVSGSVTHLNANAQVVFAGNTYRVNGAIRNPALAGCVYSFEIEREGNGNVPA